MTLELIENILDLNRSTVKSVKIENREIHVELEMDNFPVCPQCEQVYIEAPKDRRIQVVEDLSICGKRVFLYIEKRRIDCSCGYSGTEYIEWLDPYQRSTNRFRNWIYTFCKRMTCIDVAKTFGISKYLVYQLDKEGIRRELAEQESIDPKQIGVDEISRKKGHRYASIISAVQERKILEVVKERKSTDLEPFFKEKGTDWCNNIQIATMDAWLGFRKVVRKYCKNARIAFDHFHLVQHFSKAIDAVRIQEAKRASKNQKDVYRGTRWLLLKNPENLKDDQKLTLERLLNLNKKLLTMYLLRERFREIFRGSTSRSRCVRLTIWIREAKSAKIGPLTEFAAKIERWKPFIVNALEHNYSNAFAEGLNNKIRVIQRMAYGYKDFEYLRLKIFQQFNFRDIRSVYDCL